MENNITNLLMIPRVSQDRHYWIIRTNGGDYYQDFVLHQYISIAWDYVSLNILYNQSDDEIKRLVEVYERSSHSVDDDDEADETSKGKITAIINKINRFVFEIDKKDIVLIPSKNSDTIAIAEVTSDVYETENYVESYLKDNPNTEINPCPYRKRRKIKVLKTITKNQMDIYLSKGFYSQHALSNMDEYAPYINRTIYGMYLIGDDLHTTLHAGHPNGISLKELVELSSYIEKASYSLAEQCGLPFDSSQIEVKLNIHSPGLIEMIGAIAAGGAILSLFIFCLNNLINGGKFNITFKKDDVTNEINFSINSETPGLKGNMQKDKNLELTEKTQLLELIDKLDVKTPEIIASILNGKAVTPEMISDAQNSKSLLSKSEQTMQVPVNTVDESSSTE